MKISKAIFAVVTGAALSSAAMAQDQAAVTAEKTTGIKSLLPGAYANVQMRHYTVRKMDDDTVVNDIPRLEVRPNIGTTLFNDKVDTSMLWIFNKKAGSQTVNKTVLENITQVKVLDGKNGFIGPYAETVQANGVSFSESYVGLYGEGSYDLALAPGTLTLGGWIQPNAVLKSGKWSKDSESLVPVTNKTGHGDFALAEGDDNKIEQRDPSLFSLNAVNAKFKPAAIPGFSVGAEIEYDQLWKPKYSVKDVEGDARAEQDGYATSGLTTSKFILSYKVSDNVSLTNSLRHMTGGFYDHRIDSDNATTDNWEGTSRWENRIIVSATLL